MYKIAVVGSADSVIGFKALGLETYAVENGEETKKVLHALAKESGEESCAIIYVEETMAAGIMDEIRKYDEQPRPAIILIPGRDGPIGLGQTALQEAVEKAVGSDIL